MAKATLIFPHQLFEQHPCLNKRTPVYLIEHPRFFTDFTFHKQKIVLHRASMKAYRSATEHKEWLERHLGCTFLELYEQAQKSAV